MSTHNKIDFIGIGAQRCGTSWLSECMRQHPEILFPLRLENRHGQPFRQVDHQEKELHFFNSDFSTEEFDERLEGYLQKFPPAHPGKIRGEYTPGYLSSRDAAKRIKQSHPNAKLIVALRDPVEMIYSRYHLSKYTKQQARFEDDLDRHLDVGLHYRNISRYLELFPRNQIHIIFFADIKNHPQKVVRELYEFLEVDESFVPSMLNEQVNSGQKVRSKAVMTLARSGINAMNKVGFSRLAKNKTLYRLYRNINLKSDSSRSPMNPATRKQLKAYYRTDIEQLEHLTSRDLSAWK